MSAADSTPDPEPPARPSIREFRIFHVYPAKELPSWIERHQVIVSFFLTSIIGGAVTFAYQSIAVSIEKQREIRLAQRAATREFLPKLVDAAERRNYFAYRILSDLDEIRKGQEVELVKQLLADDRAKYRTAVETWNLQRHYYERFLEVYVSADLRKRFYDVGDSKSVVVQFQRLHSIIQTELMAAEHGGANSEKNMTEANRLREQLSGNLAFIYDELLRRSADE